MVKGYSMFGQLIIFSIGYVSFGDVSKIELMACKKPYLERT